MSQNTDNMEKSKMILFTLVNIKISLPSVLKKDKLKHTIDLTLCLDHERFSIR